MNLKSKLEKLEKKMIPNQIPQNIFAKLGMTPICYTDCNQSEQEKREIINTTKKQYFDKLACELNTKPDKAEELYIKTGLCSSPLVIEIIK